MCYTCDDWYLKPGNDYMVSPLCPELLSAVDVEVKIDYNASYDAVTITLRSHSNALHTMAYRLHSEVIAISSTEELLARLHNGFQPFYDMYPQAKALLEKIVIDEHKPKMIAPMPSSELNYSNYFDSYGKKPAYINTYQKKYAKGGYVKGAQKYELYEASFNAGSGRRPEVDKLPGLTEMVKYPGKKFDSQYKDGIAPPLTMTLEKCIITLNDHDKWTREQIADWLETLDVDITFRSTDADEV